MMAPRTRVRLDADLLAEIDELATERGATPGQIYRALQKRHPKTDLPSIRTIQRAVHDLTGVDGSARWTLAPMTVGSGDSRQLLDTLAEVMIRSEGHVQAMSQDLAGWVLAVGQAAPDLPPYFAWRTAHLYQLRSSKDEDRSDLDAWLAFTPWRGKAENERYKQALGWGVPRAPMLTEDMYGAGHTSPEFRDALLRLLTDGSNPSDQSEDYRLGSSLSGGGGVDGGASTAKP